MKDPDRVNTIMQNMIANGSQRLQVSSVISAQQFTYLHSQSFFLIKLK